MLVEWTHLFVFIWVLILLVFFPHKAWRGWVRGCPQGQAWEGGLRSAWGLVGEPEGWEGWYQLWRTMTQGGSFILIFVQVRGQNQKHEMICLRLDKYKKEIAFCFHLTPNSSCYTLKLLTGDCQDLGVTRLPSKWRWKEKRRGQNVDQRRQVGVADGIFRRWPHSIFSIPLLLLTMYYWALPSRGKVYFLSLEPWLIYIWNMYLGSPEPAGMKSDYPKASLLETPNGESTWRKKFLKSFSCSSPWLFEPPQTRPQTYVSKWALGRWF